MTRAELILREDGYMPTWVDRMGTRRAEWVIQTTTTGLSLKLDMAWLKADEARDLSEWISKGLEDVGQQT